MSAATDSAEKADQAEVIAFLGSPAAYGNATMIERVETHGAVVFLAGSDVYKIKRAVRFDYMDFSTLALRRKALAREIELNRPQAPDLYLGLVPVTREANGMLALGGSGEIVEWAMHMRRFPTDALLGRVAEAGPIGAPLALQIADAVHACHRGAIVSRTERPGEQLPGIVAELAEGLSAASMPFDQHSVARLHEACGRHIERTAGILERRAREGFVRRCHGDLHLDNIVLWHGRPVLFDALEFDEALATIDTLYDLAFLLMDLDRRGQRSAANAVLNQYLWRTREIRDLEGLAAMPLFLGLRAAIRAMVRAQRAIQRHAPLSDPELTVARAYFNAALDYVSPPRPRLIAVGGMSGTGKSTLAAALAPSLGGAPGAVLLRSDLERKAMFGVEATARLPQACYADHVNRDVYALLLAKAKAVLAAGHAVVLDAAYLQAGERQSVEALATSLSVPFQGLWLAAPAEVLVQRVEARTGDASDATVDVLRRQLAWRPDGGDWALIDASGSAASTLEGARSVICADAAAGLRT